MTAPKPVPPHLWKRCRSCLGDYPPKKYHAPARRCRQCESLRQRIIRAEIRQELRGDLHPSDKRTAQLRHDIDRAATIRQQAGIRQAAETMAILADEHDGPAGLADWLTHRIELAERYADEKTALRMMAIVATIGGIAAMLHPDEIEERIARLGAKQRPSPRQQR
jgi:hypothetical protein